MILMIFTHNNFRLLHNLMRNYKIFKKFMNFQTCLSWKLKKSISQILSHFGSPTTVNIFQRVLFHSSETFHCTFSYQPLHLFPETIWLDLDLFSRNNLQTTWQILRLRQHFQNISPTSTSPSKSTRANTLKRFHL